jgi:hypothetical protein
MTHQKQPVIFKSHPNLAFSVATFDFQGCFIFWEEYQSTERVLIHTRGLLEKNGTTFQIHCFGLSFSMSDYQN